MIIAGQPPGPKVLATSEKICGPDLTDWVYNKFKKMSGEAKESADKMLKGKNFANMTTDETQGFFEDLAEVVFDAAGDEVQVFAEFGRDTDRFKSALKKLGIPCPKGGWPCDLSLWFCNMCVKMEFITNLLYALAVYHAFAPKHQQDTRVPGAITAYFVFCIVGEKESNETGRWDEGWEDRYFYLVALGLDPDVCDIAQATPTLAFPPDIAMALALGTADDIPRPEDSLTEFCKKVTKNIEKWGTKYKSPSKGTTESLKNKLRVECTRCPTPNLADRFLDLMRNY